jgi:DNA polymerase-4
MDKPDGLYVIRPRDAQALIDALPVRKFHGIGPATNKKMLSLGVETGADLRALDAAVLVDQFKNSAEYYYRIARGIDLREVKVGRKRRSFGSERTFSKDISDIEEIENKLITLTQDLSANMKARSFGAHTITLKFKFFNFKQITRSQTLKEPINLDSQEHLQQLVKKLLNQAELKGRAVRLLGVSFSNLFPIDAGDRGTGESFQQLSLLD